MVRAWSLPSSCFLRQETLLYALSLHPVYKWVPAIIMSVCVGGGGGGVGGKLVIR